MKSTMLMSKSTPISTNAMSNSIRASTKLNIFRPHFPQIAAFALGLNGAERLFAPFSAKFAFFAGVLAVFTFGKANQLIAILANVEIGNLVFVVSHTCTCVCACARCIKTAYSHRRTTLRPRHLPRRRT